MVCSDVQDRVSHVTSLSVLDARTAIPATIAAAAEDEAAFTGTSIKKIGGMLFT